MAAETCEAKAPWRLLVDGAANGGMNMATDQALFERVQAGGRPVLRLYRWDPPCLSLGRNQGVLYDPARVRAAGATLVRRPTGGLAVYHDRELTYAVMAPVAVAGRPRAAFVRISEAIAIALQTLRLPVAVATRRGTSRPVAGAAEPCFAEAAPGEVVAGGRKLVGSAQRCERQTLLQHGSLLLDSDQSIISTWLVKANPVEAGWRAITVRELTADVPSWTQLCSALVNAIAAAFLVRLEPDALTEQERARIRQLESHFASEAWTWRH
ncbi:MAG: lipoate--protein ligase family protein [Longimicrobiales bacterium]